MSQIQLNASPHRNQGVVHHNDARFKVLACGRRWGKTRLGVNECVDVASQGGRAWWVSPSYKTGEVGWRPLRSIGARIGAEVRKVDRTINLSGGGSVGAIDTGSAESVAGAARAGHSPSDHQT